MSDRHVFENPTDQMVRLECKMVNHELNAFTSHMINLAPGGTFSVPSNWRDLESKYIIAHVATTTGLQIAAIEKEDLKVWIKNGEDVPYL